MYKNTLIVFIALCIVGCMGNSQNKDYLALKQQIDSLKNQVNQLKPGLGEYMLSVQMHHNKLWFAGKKPNWQLAKFEIDEIREQFANAIAVETDREEIKSIPMIYPALDSMDVAINKQDTNLFKKNYILLTTTCNDCHNAVHFQFNQVKIPESPMFTNQVW